MATISGLILFGLMLAMATIAAGALAAAIVGSVALFATLLLTLRSVRRGRGRVESGVKGVHQQEVTSLEIGARGKIVTIAGLIIFVLMLAVATIAASALAAMVVGCAALAATLLTTLLSLRRERERVESRVRGVHQKYSSIVDALTSAMGLRDDMSASHALEVSDLAFILAQQMRLGREETQLIQRAAVLADIGKMEIAEGILAKEGKLSDGEWDEMRRHPELGSNILADILNLSDAAEVVLAHHERFDGQGYPYGLKGDKIPVGSRIYAVADAYTAMTSDRPHRKKMSHEVALKEILRNSLTQFDPDVVRAFVRAEEMGLFGERNGSANGARAADLRTVAVARETS
ncbi:MAG: HD-GYP domain-containing protein [Chloroflexi bacterium]|nr:HD-GYP domain-containing protein [Chloroflexota bacterium]